MFSGTLVSVSRDVARTHETRPAPSAADRRHRECRNPIRAGDRREGTGLMWPWEHAAVGYVFYSLFSRVVFRRPPDSVSAVVVVGATQLPDAVDKPLSWGFDLFPTGFAVAHSVFVAVPVGLAVAVLAARRGRRAYGLAFVLGYWSHLFADVVNPLRSGDGVDVGRLLWPLVEQEPYGRDLGLGRGLVYLAEFVAGFPPSSPTGAAMVYLALPVLAFALWVADGAPGLVLVRDLALQRLP